MMSYAKTTNKSAKPETVFVFSFALASLWKDFHQQMHSIENRCIIGPGNVLFASASVHLALPEILQAGAVKGLITSKNKTNKNLCFSVAVCPQNPQDLLGQPWSPGRPPRLSHSSWASEVMRSTLSISNVMRSTLSISKVMRNTLSIYPKWWGVHSVYPKWLVHSVYQPKVMRSALGMSKVMRSTLDISKATRSI